MVSEFIWSFFWIQFGEFIVGPDQLITLTYRIILPDGRLRWIRATSEKELDEEGHVKSLTGAILDASEYMETLQQIKSSNFFLNETLRLANIGSWTLQLDEGNLEVSNQVFQIYGTDSNHFEYNFEKFLSKYFIK